MAYDQTANALPAEIVRPDDPLLVSERVAVAAFLAGYSGSTREYCQVEGIITKNPAANIRRPKLPDESRTLGLDRKELGALLVRAAAWTATARTAWSSG